MGETGRDTIIVVSSSYGSRGGSSRAIRCSNGRSSQGSTPRNDWNTNYGLRQHPSETRSVEESSRCGYQGRRCTDGNARAAEIYSGPEDHDCEIESNREVRPVVRAADEIPPVFIVNHP